jgi:hypothetical protein
MFQSFWDGEVVVSMFTFMGKPCMFMHACVCSAKINKDVELNLYNPRRGVIVFCI